MGVRLGLVVTVSHPPMPCPSQACHTNAALLGGMACTVGVVSRKGAMTNLMAMAIALKVDQGC